MVSEEEEEEEEEEQKPRQGLLLWKMAVREEEWKV